MKSVISVQSFSLYGKLFSNVTCILNLFFNEHCTDVFKIFLIEENYSQFLLIRVLDCVKSFRGPAFGPKKPSGRKCEKGKILSHSFLNNILLKAFQESTFPKTFEKFWKISVSLYLSLFWKPNKTRKLKTCYMRFKGSSFIFLKIVSCLMVEIDSDVILDNSEYFQSVLF